MINFLKIYVQAQIISLLLFPDIEAVMNLDDNNITLNDCFVDIYPHDFQICQNDSKCLGINYTTNVLICDCENKVYDDEKNTYKYELTKSDEILNYFKDFNNLVEYFSDMLNYKIIKSFDLLYNIGNYKKNTGFLLE